MSQDIPLLNNFLATLSTTKRFTPAEYFAYASVRMNSVGFVIETPSQADLSKDFGDIYLVLDQWKDALSDENQLEKRFGQKFYFNLVWASNGDEVIAQVIPESEVEKDTADDEYGVPNLDGTNDDTTRQN